MWPLPKQDPPQLRVLNSRGLNIPKDGDSTAS